MQSNEQGIGRRAEKVEPRTLHAHPLEHERLKLQIKVAHGVLSLAYDQVLYLARSRSPMHALHSSPRLSLPLCFSPLALYRLSVIHYYLSPQIGHKQGRERVTI